MRANEDEPTPPPEGPPPESAAAPGPPPPPLFGPGMFSPGSEFEVFILQRAGMTGVLALLLSYQLISAGHLSARVFTGSVPRHGLSDIPGILWRFTLDPLAPDAAFEPVNTGGELPGAPAFWATFFVLLAVHIGGGLLVYTATRRRRGGPGDGPWADAAEAGPLLVKPTPAPAAAGKLVIGWQDRHHVAIDRHESLLVLGPANAYMTSTFAVPSLLEWEGPALVATTRLPAAGHTHEWRSGHGRVRVYDPAGASIHPRSGWAPLSYCGNWKGAIHMAQHLTAGAYGAAGWTTAGSGTTPADRIEQGGALWGGAMAMTLAPYLYAGAVEGRDILEVAEWLEREERDEVLGILSTVDDVAAHTLETAFYREDVERSAYLHHMYQLLSIYGDPVVAASATKNQVVPSELLNGGANTYYLVAPDHDRVRFQPLFATIVRQVLAEVNDKVTTGGEALDPPLLVLVDGVMGAASLRLLAQMSLSGGERGVQVVTICDEHDWEQMSETGVVGSLVKSHRNTAVLRGTDLGGGQTEVARSWGEVGHELAEGEGALFHDNGRPVWFRVRNWRGDDRLRQKVEEPVELLPAHRRPALDNPAPADIPSYDLVGQRSAWWRRGLVENDSDGSEETVGTGHVRKRAANVFRDGSDRSFG